MLLWKPRPSRDPGRPVRNAYGAAPQRRPSPTAMEPDPPRIAPPERPLRQLQPRRACSAAYSRSVGAGPRCFNVCTHQPARADSVVRRGIHDSSAPTISRALTTSAARSRRPRITRGAVPEVKVVNKRREFLEHARDFKARVPHVQVLHPGELRHRSRDSAQPCRARSSDHPWCDSCCRAVPDARLGLPSAQFSPDRRAYEHAPTRHPWRRVTRRVRSAP